MIIFVCAHDGMCGGQQITLGSHPSSPTYIRAPGVGSKSPDLCTRLLHPWDCLAGPQTGFFFATLEFATLEFEIDAVFHSLLVGKEKKVT